MDMHTSDGLDDRPKVTSAQELEAFAHHMIGTADTLEMMGENFANQLRGVAAEMAAQIRTRATEALALARDA